MKLTQLLGRQFKQRWLNWLNKRIPPDTSHALNMQSVFIFPTLFGWGYLLMCLCVFLLGTNYQNNLMLFLCYFLLALALINLFSSFLNFSALRLQSHPVSPVYAGEPATQTLLISAQQERALNGLINARWWDDSHPVTADINGGQNQLLLPRFTDRRGVFRLPRVTLWSDYPLGLFRCWTHLDLNQQLTVYPSPKPSPVRLTSTSGEGDRETSQPGHDEFYALQDYVQGEPLHRVAWKHVAKGGNWVTKAFSQQQSDSGYLSLDTTKPLEQALSELTSQIDKLSENGDHFGLHLPGLDIAPGSGSEHRHRCLRSLAVYPGGGMR